MSIPKHVSSGGISPDQIRQPNQITQRPTSFYLEPVTEDNHVPTGGDGKSVLDYVLLVLHRRFLLIICAVLGLAGGIAVTFYQTPMFQARTTIEIRQSRNGAAYLADAAANAPGQGQDSGGDLETQIRILESDALNTRVGARLRAEHPGRVYRGQDVVAELRKKLDFPEKKNVLTSTEMPAVGLAIGVVGSSRIVEIICSSWDPELAKDYANTLADEYLNYSTERLLASSGRINSWLNDQVRAARAQLENSQQQLQTYAESEKLIYTGAEQLETADQQRLRDLQADLDKATSDRMLRQSLYEVSKASPTDSIPAVADSLRINDMRTRLEELRRNYLELSALYTDSHPRVVNVLSQITAVETALERERTSIVSRIQNDYAQAQRTEQMLAGAYEAQIPQASETARKGIRYGLMKWEVDTNRKIYEELLQQVKAMTIGSSLQADSSSVLDLSGVPNKPYSPNISRNLLMGTASSLMLGILFALLIESINRRLKSPGESEFHLGIPELGVIPTLSTSEGVGVLRLQKSSSSNYDESGNRREVGEAVDWGKTSPLMAEAYRNALTSILLSSMSTDRPQVILITSSARGEGKSTVASNLARALAEINQKVLLIDADLRRPTLHDGFGVSNLWGLSDILHEKTSLASAPLDVLAKPTSVEGLYLLSSGPRMANIANLFYSDRMSELVERLRTEFDTIIIDTPPISFLSDARILGRVADGAVLVLRAGVTTRDDAMAAKRRLKDDGIHLLGTILNAWDGNKKARYGYGQSYYSKE
ncbi:MAG: polysaccharide biosynthesis tyrosine autokinase [Acidobacteriota bacterium]